MKMKLILTESLPLKLSYFGQLSCTIEYYAVCVIIFRSFRSFSNFVYVYILEPYFICPCVLLI